MAVLFTATQVPARTLMDEDTKAPAQAATANQDTHVTAASTATTTDLSAPVPNLDEATLVKPMPDSPFAIAAAQDLSSSSSSAVTPAPKAVPNKPPHRGLGIALAVTGTTFLVASAFFFGLQNHFCSGINNTDCTTIRTDTILGMSLSAPVAALGYYWQFHK